MSFQVAIRSAASAGALLAIALAAGCGQQTAPPAAKAAGPSAAGGEFLLAAPPADAQQVIAARESAQADEDVVIVGRIGGGANPWVDGMAAFSLVDTSLKACSDIPGDTCPTPWDYCCEADLPKARTLVKFVDASGEIVATDARQLLGVTELQTVYVKGKAHRDADGNLTVLARGIYAQPAGSGPATQGHDHNHDHDHDHAHANPGRAGAADNAPAPAALEDSP